MITNDDFKLSKPVESEEDTGDEIENAIEKVFEGLVEGLNLIAMIGNGGDPQLRLEKHLIRMVSFTFSFLLFTVEWLLISILAISISSV